MHLDDVSLPQLIISPDYEAFAENFFSPERAIPRRANFLSELTFSLFFIRFLFHVLMRETGVKENFFLNNTTRSISCIRNLIYNETGFAKFLNNRQHLVVIVAS